MQQAAAKRFIGIGLELGGKDPGYVRADADLAFAVENLVDGSFFNSGQSCCGIERIYVDKRVFKPFVEAFVGSPGSTDSAIRSRKETNLGPLVHTEPRTTCARRSARRYERREAAAQDERPAGYALPPEVLVNVDHGMTVMAEETFGPVVGIQPVKGDEKRSR